MTALPPIAVRDATAAAMLELPLPKFRELVAAGALPPGRPEGGMEVLFRMIAAKEQTDHAKVSEAYLKQDEWDALNPLVEIAHPEAGASFNHGAPGDCADNLERLRAEGFNVPQHAIDALRVEQSEMEQTAPKP